MAAGNFFGGQFFGGGFFGAIGEVAADTSGARLQRAKKPKKRVIRWSDYARDEERAAALAAALAEAAVPLAAIPKEDEADVEIEEEDALITALVLARVIH